MCARGISFPRSQASASAIARLVWLSFQVIIIDRAKRTPMIASAIFDLSWRLASITIKGGSKTTKYRSEPHGPKNQRTMIRPNWMDAYQTKRPSGFPMPAEITSTTLTIITAEEKRESTKRGEFNHEGRKSGAGGPCKRRRSLPRVLNCHIPSCGLGISPPNNIEQPVKINKAVIPPQNIGRLETEATRGMLRGRNARPPCIKIRNTPGTAWL